MSSTGLTTLFSVPGPKEFDRIKKNGFEFIKLRRRSSGIILSKDWDASRPTLLFCHGRTGNAGSGSYMNIAKELAHHKYAGNCNIALVLHHAPGNLDTMVNDGLQAMDHLLHSKGVKPEQINLAGYSIGCITSSAIAHSFPQAGRLTLLLPPTSMPEAAAYTFRNRGMRLIGVALSFALASRTRNHRNTVDYIAGLHQRAAVTGTTVMPVEALLSRDDKVADPQAFIAGLTERGVRDAVHIAIEAMQNSSTAHTEAFSLADNFPQLVGSPILHEERGRMAPLVGSPGRPAAAEPDIKAPVPPR